MTDDDLKPLPSADLATIRLKLDHELPLTEPEAAFLRNVRPETLARERLRGGGPPFTYVGRRIYYPAAAFRAWMTDRPMYGSTSAKVAA